MIQLANYLDGFGQMMLIKGYESEGIIVLTKTMVITLIKELVE
ncbi:hypothetical protein [Clostridium perfringens]